MGKFGAFNEFFVVLGGNDPDREVRRYRTIPLFRLLCSLGKTLTDILLNLLRQPLPALQAFLFCPGHTSAPGVYPLLLLAPLGFLPLLAPDALIFGLPSYALIALSERPIMRELGYWHSSLVLPWLMVANAIAWGRLLRWEQTFSPPHRTQWHQLLALYCLTCLLFSAWRYGLPTVHRFTHHTLPPEQAQAIRALLNRLITPNASVSATSSLVPLLAHRREIYLFPNPFQPFMWGASKEAVKEQMGQKKFPPLPPNRFLQQVMQTPVEFIALMPRTHLGPLRKTDYTALALSVLTCPAYGVIAAQDGVIILRRGADFLLGLRRLGVDASAFSEPQNLFEAVRERWRQLMGEVQ